LRAWDELKEFIVFVHLKNVKEKDGCRSYCRIGEGMIDYKKLLSRFAKDSYSGPLCLEYEEPIDVEKGTKDDISSLNALISGAPSKMEA